MTSSDRAAEPGARSPGDAAAEVERLRVELEHRDQLLAAVYARADALQREIELLERQLAAAIDAQREAATERSELRRLLGNAQLQVHSLLRIAPPGGAAERAGEPTAAPDEARAAVAGGTAEPDPARVAEPERPEPPSEEPAAEQPAAAPERQRAPSAGRAERAGRATGDRSTTPARRGRACRSCSSRLSRGLAARAVRRC